MQRKKVSFDPVYGLDIPAESGIILSMQTLQENNPPEGKIILYSEGEANINVRVEGETVWLTQAGMADLYQTTPQNITIHVKSIYKDGELDESATCKDYLQVQTEGKRQVRRSLKHYSLEMVLAVGYRVRSQRGTLFRQWATQHLEEFSYVPAFARRQQLC